uniref:Threonine aldolase n=1 Tax=Thermosporothrix sp. COM3 TaxID=2490863 RepID=A0A455SM57_9CHLR|nr:threonine aldolase [Thermosporothrix sp. COM3]
MIELRSDTFTLPGEAMRRAMMQAELGDDVYGEDPTTRKLEERAAEIFAKEAACLMPSGTMANLTALMAHCPRGGKVLVGNESDIFIYEAGGASVCGGIIYEPIPTQPDGRLLLSDLAKGFPDDVEDPQFALPALICLENTHNRCGGTVLPLEYLEEVAQFAREREVPLHLDGARIFNAAIALGQPPAAIARYATSLQFCLSKGLAAPIGSMLVGSAALIQRARRVRKMLGGGMRQAGIIAAAGLFALDHMVERLHEDHLYARRFAEGLAELPGVQVDLETVQTNIVLFRVQQCSYQMFIETAAHRGLRLGELGYGRLRAVFHYGNTPDDVDRALEIIRTILTVDLEAAQR